MRLLYSNLYETSSYVNRVEAHVYENKEEYDTHKKTWLQAGFIEDCKVVEENGNIMLRWMRIIKKECL